MPNGEMDTYEWLEAERRYEAEKAGLYDPRRGTKFGPVTATRLGLSPEYYYPETILQPYFEKLMDWYDVEQALLRAKAPVKEGLTYWARGMQLGLSPEEYLKGWRKLQAEGMPSNKEDALRAAYLYGYSNLSPETGYHVQEPLRAVPTPVVTGRTGGAATQAGQAYPFLQDYYTQAATTPTAPRAETATAYRTSRFAPPTRWLVY